MQKSRKAGAEAGSQPKKDFDRQNGCRVAFELQKRGSGIRCAELAARRPKFMEGDSDERLRGGDIVLPCSEDRRPHPCVTMGDPIIRAIELMVRHNLKDIVVVRGTRVLGRVRLEDAFKRMGLSKGPLLDDFFGAMER